MQQYRDLLINLNLLLLATIGCIVLLIIGWRVLTVIFPVLILLLAAMLLAFLLDPLVSKLQGLGLTRGLAVVSVYLGLLAIIFGLGSLLIVPLTGQIQGLIKNIPAEGEQVRKMLGHLDTFFKAHHIPIDLQQLQHQGINQATHIGTQLLGHTLDIVQTVAHIVIDIVAVIVISLYLLIDGPRLRHNILRIVPENPRSKVLFVEATVRTVIGAYVRGQLLLALIIGLMASLGCALIGVHFPLVIGLVAGFFELVPMLGPILGALPAIGIAVTQGGWQLALATVVVFVVIQQLEAHLIAPRVMGRAVGVHPIVAILAVLLGAELDGILGALVAVPVAGIIYVIAQAIYSHFTGQLHTVTVVEHRQPVYVRWFKRVVLRAAPTGADGADGRIKVTVEAASDQLAGIVHERDVLAEQFARTEEVAKQRFRRRSRTATKLSPAEEEAPDPEAVSEEVTLPSE